jgi:MFS family permease
MIWSIIAYAALTGLTALSPSLEVLIALRFLTGLALGSEWCTGASMIQEKWPERSRTKGACFVQSGFGVGSLIAALVWLIVGYLDPGGWRWVFLVGAIPGLMVFWLRRKLPESERWERATERLREAGDSAKTPARRLLDDPAARRTVLLLLVVSMATVVGWYAVASFLPVAAKNLAEAAGMGNPGRFVSWTLIAYTVGSVCGYWAAAFVADRFGRRRLIAVFLLGSYALTVLVYLWSGPAWAFMAIVLVNGAFTLGGFAWIPIYVPELFGSAVRATASGFVFNATRLVAWVGPILTGTLIAAFGGVKLAAICMGVVYLIALTVVPQLRETRGEPLPD